MSITRLPEPSTTQLSPCLVQESAPSSTAVKQRLTDAKAIEIIQTSCQWYVSCIKTYLESPTYYSSEAYSSLRCILKQQMQTQNKSLSDRAIFKLFKAINNCGPEEKLGNFHFKVAQMYENGFGCEVNMKRATKHYANGALNKHIPSLLKIADCLDNGINVDKNPSAATYIYLKLSQWNVAEAKERLCDRLFNAGDKPIDPSKAIDFCSSLFSSMVDNLDRILRDLSRKETQTFITHGSKRSEKVKRFDEGLVTEVMSAVEKIFADVLDNDPLLKIIIENLPNPLEPDYSLLKKTTKIDSNACFAMYKYLAESGDAMNMLKLALLFMEGIGCEKSESEFKKWFQRAVDHNNPQALVMMAAAYALRDESNQLTDVERAILVPTDCKKALEYLKRSMDCGYDEAVDIYKSCLMGDGDETYILINGDDEIPYMMEKANQGNKKMAKVLFEYLMKERMDLVKEVLKERREMAMKIAKEHGFLEEISLGMAMASNASYRGFC